LFQVAIYFHPNHKTSCIPQPVMRAANAMMGPLRDVNIMIITFHWWEFCVSRGIDHSHFQHYVFSATVNGELRWCSTKVTYTMCSSSNKMFLGDSGHKDYFKQNVIDELIHRCVTKCTSCVHLCCFQTRDGISIQCILFGN